MTTSPGAAEIQTLATRWQASRALLAAFELDLFSVLGQEALTGAEAAAKAKTDPRATDRLLRAMIPLGLVELVKGRGPDRFANTEGARRFLDRASPDCMTGLGHAAYTYKNWASLDKAVRAGTAVIDTKFDNEARREAFIEAMHARARNSAADLIARIGTRGVGRVLDVGGGSGAYAMAFCQTDPGIEAVVLDLPEVTRLTRGYVEREGLAGRVATRDGDYHEADFGSGYDLILFSAIMHINSPEQNRDLVAKAAKALNPGGRVVVQDFVMDDDRLEPAYGTLFALNMLVNTAKGDVYTGSEVREWMERAGLEPLDIVPSGPTTSLVMGRKPRARRG